MKTSRENDWAEEKARELACMLAFRRSALWPGLIAASLREARDKGIEYGCERALEDAATVFEFWERNTLHGSTYDNIKGKAWKDCRLVLRDRKEFGYHLGQALKSAGGSKGEVKA